MSIGSSIWASRSLTAWMSSEAFFRRASGVAGGSTGAGAPSGGVFDVIGGDVTWAIAGAAAISATNFRRVKRREDGRLLMRTL